MATNTNTYLLSPFLRLPVELRLEIYSLAFTSASPAKIGTSAAASSHVSRWPLYPSLTQVNAVIRQESLPLYFSTQSWIFNIQDRLGMNMVIAWIARCAECEPYVLNKLRHLTIVTGSGFCERPQEVILDLRNRKVVSVRVQRPAPQDLAGKGHAFDRLRTSLGKMPLAEERGFSMAVWLTGLVREFECMLGERQGGCTVGWQGECA